MAVEEKPVAMVHGRIILPGWRISLPGWRTRRRLPPWPTHPCPAPGFALTRYGDEKCCRIRALSAAMWQPTGGIQSMLFGGETTEDEADSLLKRWFEWDLPQGISLRSSEKTLSQLEDVGLQLALTFNAEGSLLATGGEDGHMRIFKWPALETILEQSETNHSVKDLDFSSDGKFLASVVNSGVCRIWDLNSMAVVANVSRENGERFGFCRFSQTTNNDTILYTTASQGQFGRIVSWSTTSWNRIVSIKVAKDPISAFSVSSDRKFLAVGTIEGDVLILNSSGMQVHTTVRQAHLGLVTTLVFSQDSRALASASFDSTACITVIEDKKGSGMKLSVIFFIILLAVLVYYMKANGIL